MSMFKFVKNDDVIRIETPDGDEWIEVRAGLSKKDFNDLAQLGPKAERDVKGALSFAERLVKHFVKNWSMSDDAGNPIEFNMANFKNLEAAAANWISNEVLRHFNRVADVNADSDAKEDSNSDD